MEVRLLLHSGKGVGRPLLEAMAVKLGLGIEALLPFEGKPIRTLYVEGMCGGAVVPLGQVMFRHGSSMQTPTLGSHTLPIGQRMPLHGFERQSPLTGSHTWPPAHALAQPVSTQAPPRQTSVAPQRTPPQLPTQSPARQNSVAPQLTPSQGSATHAPSTQASVSMQRYGKKMQLFPTHAPSVRRHTLGAAQGRVSQIGTQPPAWQIVRVPSVSGPQVTSLQASSTQ